MMCCMPQWLERRSRRARAHQPHSRSPDLTSTPAVTAEQPRVLIAMFSIIAASLIFWILRRRKAPTSAANKQPITFSRASAPAKALAVPPSHARLSIEALQSPSDNCSDEPLSDGLLTKDPLPNATPLNTATPKQAPLYYPVYAVRLERALELDRMRPHEELLATGDVQEWVRGRDGPLIFVSQCATVPSHPLLPHASHSALCVGLLTGRVRSPFDAMAANGQPFSHPTLPTFSFSCFSRCCAMRAQATSTALTTYRQRDCRCPPRTRAVVEKRAVSWGRCWMRSTTLTGRGYGSSEQPRTRSSTSTERQLAASSAP